MPDGRHGSLRMTCGKYTDAFDDLIPAGRTNNTQKTRIRRRTVLNIKKITWKMCMNDPEVFLGGSHQMKHKTSEATTFCSRSAVCILRGSPFFTA